MKTISLQLYIFFSASESNALEGINRCFLKESKELKVPTSININHTEEIYFRKGRKRKRKHMIANVKFPGTRCHPVTLYKSITPTTMMDTQKSNTKISSTL